MNTPDDIEFVQPKDAVAFEPTEFLFTLQSCGEMARQPGLLNRPAEHGFGIIGDDGKATRYHFTDIFENRFGMAVCQRFQNDRRKYFSFMWRWFALMEVVQSGALDGHYLRRGEQEHEIHDAVFHVAASFPLTAKGRFSRRAFLSALARKSQSDETAA